MLRNLMIFVDFSPFLDFSKKKIQKVCRSAKISHKQKAGLLTSVTRDHNKDTYDMPLSLKRGSTCSARKTKLIYALL